MYRVSMRSASRRREDRLTMIALWRAEWQRNGQILQTRFGTVQHKRFPAQEPIARRYAWMCSPECDGAGAVTISPTSCGELANNARIAAGLTLPVAIPRSVRHDAESVLRESRGGSCRKRDEASQCR